MPISQLAKNRTVASDAATVDTGTDPTRVPPPGVEGQVYLSPGDPHELTDEARRSYEQWLRHPEARERMLPVPPAVRSYLRSLGERYNYGGPEEQQFGERLLNSPEERGELISIARDLAESRLNKEAVARLERFIATVGPEDDDAWFEVSYVAFELYARELRGQTVNLGEHPQEKSDLLAWFANRAQRALDALGRDEKAPSIGPFRQVSESEVKTRLAQIDKERRQALKELIEGRFSAINSAPPPATEDINNKAPVFRVHGNDTLSPTLIANLARVGAREGFQVLASGDWGPDQGTLTRRERAHLTEFNIPNADVTNVWIEDSSHVSKDGTVSVLPKVDNDLLREAEGNDRRRRAEEFKNRTGHELDLRLAGQGVSAKTDQRAGAVAYALAAGKPTRAMLGYIEGGNVVLGTRATGEPYAVVGKDTVAITRAILERDASQVMGRPVQLTQEQVRVALAKDLGVDVDNVVLTEQPGNFHVDMALTAWTPGVVLLNDARAAGQVLIDHSLESAMHFLPPLPNGASLDDIEARKEAIAALEQMTTTSDVSLKLKSTSSYAKALQKYLDSEAKELRKLRTQQTQRARVEDVAAADLEAQGLRVIRVPSRFSIMGSERTNFANGIGGVGQDGQRFFITQGSRWPRHEVAFLSALQEAGVAVPRIYFLEDGASTRSVLAKGGIACRVKVHR